MYNKDMENLVLLGNTIKEKRLMLNMTTDVLARKAGVSRQTISFIENGKGNYSIITLLRIIEILDISLKLNSEDKLTNRERATRINTKMSKKINRFIIMCVEQYASFINKQSGYVYKLLSNKGVIDELKEDYEDLHGMSTLYLNNYISGLVG